MSPYRIPVERPVYDDRTPFLLRALSHALLLTFILFSPAAIFLASGCGASPSPAVQRQEQILVKVGTELCQEEASALQPPESDLVLLVCDVVGQYAEGATQPTPVATAVDAGSATPAPPVMKARVLVPRDWWKALHAPAVDAGM